jgi:hypothetical protein
MPAAPNHREQLAKEEAAAKRQHLLWRRTHKRGHAKAARRDLRAVRALKLLISREERRRRRLAPKVMFDDTTVGLIPLDAPAVLGYVDGRYETFPTIEKEFPHAHKLPCTVFTPGKARCLDIETGDATPEQAPDHVHKRQKTAPHELPVLYANITTMALVVAHLEGAGFHHREYLLFSAHYTFHPHICGPKTCGYPTKCDCTQWTNIAFGRSLDESRISPDLFLTYP